MAEIAGKVGAFYATSGTGTVVTAESGTLAARSMWLDQKNVIVSNVYVGRPATSSEHVRWYCTPRGKLTVSDAGATANVNVTYRWWAEEGETGSTKGIMKPYGGFFSWSIDNTADVVDKTDFDDSGHKTYLASLDGWTATAERHWVDEGMLGMLGTLDTALHIIAKFYVENDDTDKGVGSASDTGSRYEGYCHLTGISPSVAVDTLMNESLSFQGTGQLTYEAGA